jgi:hypothetical protein
VRTLWDLYWHGELDKNIPPYRTFHTYDVREADRSNFSKGVQVMKALENLVVADNPSIIMRNLVL